MHLASEFLARSIRPLCIWPGKFFSAATDSTTMVSVDLIGALENYLTVRFEKYINVKPGDQLTY